MWNIVSSNRICTDKFQEELHYKHLSHLSRAKPYIDTAEPYKPIFLRLRANYIKKKSDFHSQVQQQNQILLNKMLEIEKKNGHMNPNNLMKHYRPAQKTFNSTARINSLKKINNDNQQLIKRLSECKTHYSSEKFIQQGKQAKNLAQRMSNNAKRSKHFNFPSFNAGLKPSYYSINNLKEMSRMEPQKKNETQGSVYRPTSAPKLQ